MKNGSVYQLLFQNYPDVVNSAQMCEMLGNINIKAGYELLRSGRIKCFVIGRSYRIPKIHILEYMGVMGDLVD